MARAGRHPLFDRIDISVPQNSRPYRRRPLSRLLTFLADSGGRPQARAPKPPDKGPRTVVAEPIFSTQRRSHNQFQARPYVGNSTHLHVDKVGFERNRSDAVFVKIGGYRCRLQETQIAPLLRIHDLAFGSFRSKTAIESTKICTMSQSPLLPLK